jgi:hypothetical protein
MRVAEERIEFEYLRTEIPSAFVQTLQGTNASPPSSGRRRLTSQPAAADSDQEDRSRKTATLTLGSIP